MTPNRCPRCRFCLILEKHPTLENDPVTKGNRWGAGSCKTCGHYLCRKSYMVAA